MLAFLLGFFGQFLQGIRGFATRMASSLTGNRLMEGTAEDERPLREGNPEFMDAEKCPDAPNPIEAEKSLDAENPMLAENCMEAEKPLDAENPMLAENCMEAEKPLDAENPMLAENCMEAEKPLDAENAMDADKSTGASAVTDEPPSPGHDNGLDLCRNTCGRPVAEGFDTCCRTCIASNGHAHGPLCNSKAADDGATTEATTPAGHRVWWVNLGSWVRIDNATQALIEAARRAGQSEVEFHARGHPYLIDLTAMTQINMNTGMQREIKHTEEDEEPEEEEEEDETSDNEITPPWMMPKASREVAAAPSRSARLTALVDLLLSPTVQVPLPAEATEEKEKLSQEEVKTVFKEHVKGVEKYLFRDMPGQFSLNFLASAYQNGLRAFNGTPMDNHLKWLMRSIVHYGHEKKPNAARYLKEVAEAFLDCQAVQARVVERVGLELLGVSQDFKGLVRAMVGDYKVMAIKMLAIDHLSRGVVSDDGNPTHYENRLTADLGSLVGLNKDDIRRADLDEHARNRFGRLQGPNAEKAVQRFKELFDVEALAKTFCNEVNSFNENTSNDSLPGQFMKWADEKMTQKHCIFDEETCCKVEVQEPLAVALLEVLFAGKPGCEDSEEYRGLPIKDFFNLELCAADTPKVEAPPAKTAPKPSTGRKCVAAAAGGKSGKAKSPPGKKARTKR